MTIGPGFQHERRRMVPRAEPIHGVEGGVFHRVMKVWGLNNGVGAVELRVCWSRRCPDRVCVVGEIRCASAGTFASSVRTQEVVPCRP